MKFVSRISANRLANRKTEWLNPVGDDADIIVSTRLALSRNVEGYKFPPRAKPAELEDVLHRLYSTIEKRSPLKGGSAYLISDLQEIARFVLLERRIISPEMAHSRVPAMAAGVFRGEELSFTINDEDHLRIQSLVSGRQSRKALRIANSLLNSFAREIEFAYSSKLGWLTSSPTNVGTGLQLNFFCHLPALVFTEKLDEVFENILSASITIRGLFGEGRHNLGSIFQISNQATLGVDEYEILERTSAVLREIVDREREARALIRESHEIKALDRVRRSYAVLTHARLLGAMEMVGYISDIKFGLYLGWIGGVSVYKLNQLVLKTLPGHLMAGMKGSHTLQEQDCHRAEVIRQELPEMKLN